jgi:hypothetical protein
VGFGGHRSLQGLKTLFEISNPFAELKDLLVELASVRKNEPFWVEGISAGRLDML